MKSKSIVLSNFAKILNKDSYKHRNILKKKSSYKTMKKDGQMIEVYILHIKQVK